MAKKQDKPNKAQASAAPPAKSAGDAKAKKALDASDPKYVGPRFVKTFSVSVVKKHKEVETDVNLLLVSQDCELMDKYRKTLSELQFMFTLRLFGHSYTVVKGKEEIIVHSGAPAEYVATEYPLLRVISSKIISNDQPIVYPGSVPAVFKLGSVKVPAGVVMVVASGDAGKSPLCKSLAKRSGNYCIIRTGEPLAHYDTGPDDVVAALVEFLFSDCKAAVLDSIKDIIALGGSLIKQGVSRQALVEMSNLSSVLCLFGKTIFVPFNVSSSDDAMLASATEMARSNATGYLQLQSSDSHSSKWIGNFRTGEGLPRTPVVVEFGKDQSLQVESVGVRRLDNVRVSPDSAVVMGVDSQSLPFSITKTIVNRGSN